MIIRYLKGDTVTIWERARRLARRRPLVFSPELELPDYLALKILANPRYIGWFIKITPETCGICGKVCKSTFGLIAHKRTHGENNEI